MESARGIHLLLDAILDHAHLLQRASCKWRIIISASRSAFLKLAESAFLGRKDLLAVGCSVYSNYLPGDASIRIFSVARLRTFSPYYYSENNINSSCPLVNFVRPRPLLSPLMISVRPAIPMWLAAKESSSSRDGRAMEDNLIDRPRPGRTAHT